MVFKKFIAFCLLKLTVIFYILLYFVFNCDNSVNCPKYFLKGESQEFMSETQCRIEYFYSQCSSTTIAAFIKT